MYAQDRKQPTCCSQVGHLDAKFFRVYCSGPVSVNSSHLKRVREVGCFHMWLFSQHFWAELSSRPSFAFPFFTPRRFFWLPTPSAIESLYHLGEVSDLRGNVGKAALATEYGALGPGWARRHDSTGWVMGSGMRGEASSGLRTPATEMRPLAMRHPPKHRAHPQRPPSMVPPGRARATDSRVPVALRRRSLPLALRQAPSRWQLQPSLERPSTHSRAAGDST